MFCLTILVLKQLLYLFLNEINQCKTDSTLNILTYNYFVLLHQTNHLRRYIRKKGQGQQSTVKFTHLILARVCSNSDDHSCLVYIMEARKQNSNIWSKNINHRDSRAISVGSFIRFPSPISVTQYMRCDIPMICLRFRQFL